MRVGIVDLDAMYRRNKKRAPFPNITCMKLSTFHKNKGDTVEWLNASRHYDKVYCAKVFSFTPNYPYIIDADSVVKFDSTLEQDIERIAVCRHLNFTPYVMLYDKASLPTHHVMRRLQRWVNNKFIFWACDNFNDYRDTKDKAWTNPNT